MSAVNQPMESPRGGLNRSSGLRDQGPGLSETTRRSPGALLSPVCPFLPYSMLGVLVGNPMVGTLDT